MRKFEIERELQEPVIVEAESKEQAIELAEEQNYIGDEGQDRITIRELPKAGECKQCQLPLEYEGGFLGDDVCYGCVVRNHKKEVGMRSLLLSLAIGMSLAVLMISGVLWMVRGG